MNTFASCFNLGRAVVKALQVVVVATPLALGAASADAAPSSCAPVRSASLDARLAARADVSPGALRRFVQVVEPIYLIDYDTAVGRVARFHRAQSQCVASGTRS